ncbi:methyl-accepting chemotaxis protein [Granulosicoccus antarcticus]|uniref:Methyl-accepting chemotaxis protein 4 n=1 Tax=Granulosicoccus antarcticus IMCC3135 TaxID=1192854 RepID=A0A2Z2NIV0_9GAMM|nr:methyl-accepting chemotaxis protein [Granulosicoccus antarcticus]ASJ71266.1 Methyl-accepting chemotaxis protein 4 [Granulosicoccus antarcticus IMCC3135]
MNNIPLVAKLAVIPVVLILALAATCLAVIDNINASREDGLLIDIAGRQRMLNQRYIKEVLVAARAEEPARQLAIEKSEQSIGLFQTTLSLMTDGGELAVSSTDGVTIIHTLRPPVSQKLQSILVANQQLMPLLSDEARNLLDAPADSVAASHESLLDISARLHIQASLVVDTLVALSRDKADDLIRVCLWISAVAALVSLLISWLTGLSIAVPVNRMQKALKRMASGDLSRPLNMTRKDEFGRISADLDALLEGISVALGSRQVRWDEVGTFFRDLRTDLQQVRAIITQSPSPMMLVNSAGEITYANPAAAREADQLHVAGHLPKVLDPANFLSQGGLALAELLACCKEQSRLPCSLRVDLGSEKFNVNLEPIHDTDADSTEALLTWQNITHDLARGKELTQSNAAAVLSAQNLSALVDQIRQVVQSAANGDLSQKIDAMADESLNAIAATINEFLASLNKDFAAINAHTIELLACSVQLKRSAVQIERSAADSNGHCVSVARSTDGVNKLMRSAATTTEEMNSSINDISGSMLGADKVVFDAVTLARSTSDTMQKLYASSTDIGSVLKTITTIAEQTNLLALNATIEAARAGDAGKGFAVVANEVKELAKQTALATDEIGSRIISIQTDSTSAVQAIASINEIVHEISEHQTSVAAALSQQNSASMEMSQTVQRTSDTSDSIHRDLQELVEKSDESYKAASDSLAASEAVDSRARALGELLSRYQLRTSLSADR